MTGLSASSELDIAAAPDRLFDLLRPASAPTWDRSVLSVDTIQGPLGPGARYRETHRLLWRPHTIDLEVIEYQPPLTIAYRTVRGGPPSTTRYELHAKSELTTVRITAEARIRGPLTLLAPLLQRTMARRLPTTLAALKNHCEAQQSR